jgi:hypothetical protein
MYPHERSLVKKMEGKPFVLLGVNSDGDKDKLHKRMEEEKITWRSWWDGGDTNGPIANQFNVHSPRLIRRLKDFDIRHSAPPQPAAAVHEIPGEAWTATQHLSFDQSV